MYIPELQEKHVSEVTLSPIYKDRYVITLTNHAGKRTNLYYTKSEMEDLLKRTGASNPNDLKRRVVIVSNRKIAFLPEGAKLTIAARDKEGKLIEFDFLD